MKGFAIQLRWPSGSVEYVPASERAATPMRFETRRRAQAHVNFLRTNYTTTGDWAGIVVVPFPSKRTRAAK